MVNQELTSLLIEWSESFFRISIQGFNRFARASGLSMLQLTVMAHLHERGPAEVTSFAEIMQTSPAGASQMVERLVQLGMVERQHAAADRRVREVHLTEAGRAIIEAARAARTNDLSALAEAIPAEKRAAVGEALRLIIEQANRLQTESDTVPGAWPERAATAPKA